VSGIPARSIIFSLSLGVSTSSSISLQSIFSAFGCPLGSPGAYTGGVWALSFYGYFRCCGGFFSSVSILFLWVQLFARFPRVPGAISTGLVGYTLRSHCYGASFSGETGKMYISYPTYPPFHLL
jgi:hypothetical protein